MANIDNELREMCLREAKWLESLFEPADSTDGEDEFDDEDAGELEDEDDEEKSPFERLEESVYDLRYTVDAQGRYLGVNLLLAGGGPTIRFDSYSKLVRGTWGFSEPIEIPVHKETCAAIDEYFEEMWDCIR